MAHFRERGWLKFKVLPFELMVNECSFHMMSMNDVSYLNSLSGKVMRMPHDRIERLRSYTSHEYGNLQRETNFDPGNLFYMPVRIVNRMDMGLNEDFYRERMMRESMSGYYHPRYDHQMYMSDYPRHDRKTSIAQTHIEDYSSGGKGENGNRGHNRQLPVPNQF